MVTFSFLAYYADANGDLLGGTCTMTGPGGAVTVPIGESSSAAPSASVGEGPLGGFPRSGSILGYAAFRYDGQQSIRLSISVTDAAGHPSNILTVDFVAKT
jgi:hypothetical protein